MNHYTGRFAPSPTGALHMGSLVAALGSFLRARYHNGKWLVRMEDLDPLREEAGAADAILRMLEAHGLHWDDAVEYQSRRQQHYQHASQQLLEQQIIYPCMCSRRILRQTARRGPHGLIYPGTCRNKTFTSNNAQTSIRILTRSEEICFDDLRCGKVCQNLADEVGDFIIKRTDGFFAYQLAVVVDDHLQGITEVVRGEDLLDNTPRQIYLQRLLGYAIPDYLHLPMVKNEHGQKLSKQTHAPALHAANATENLLLALRHLGFPENLRPDADSVEAILHHAIQRLQENAWTFWPSS